MLITAHITREETRIMSIITRLKILNLLGIAHISSFEQITKIEGKIIT